jgi:hypothetical protein
MTLWPGLTNWVPQQVGRYPGCSGLAASAFGKAARDPSGKMVAISLPLWLGFLKFSAFALAFISNETFDPGAQADLNASKDCP